MWAAIQGRLETLDILRTANVDLEVHDDNGATALLLAVQHKRPLAMLGLLSMGANIDAGVCSMGDWLQFWRLLACCYTRWAVIVA
mgnify:CR=1 FL=1